MIKEIQKNNSNKLISNVLFYFGMLFLFIVFSNNMNITYILMYILSFLVGIFSIKYSLFLILFTYTKCFSLLTYFDMPGDITDFGLIASFCSTIVVSCKYLKENDGKIKKQTLKELLGIVVVLINLALCAFVAYFRYSQPIYYGLLPLRKYLIVVFPISLIRYFKEDHKRIYEILDSLSIMVTISILLIMFQIFLEDKIVFLRMMFARRIGSMRLLLHDVSVLYSLVFAYELKKIIETKGKKIYSWISILLVLYSIFILSQTKIFMLGIMTITILEIFMYSKMNIGKKFIAFIVCLIVSIIIVNTSFFTQYTNKVFSDLIRNGNSYIRNLEAKYFSSLIKDNYFIFGIGIMNPNYRNSPVIEANELGYYLSDIGLLGMFLEYGVFGIVALLVVIYMIVKNTNHFSNKENDIDILVKIMMIFVFVTFLTVSPFSSSICVLLVLMYSLIKTKQS